jgi:translation initiation factor 2 gamma subunit (eIF-2gamma)
MGLHPPSTKVLSSMIKAVKSVVVGTAGHIDHGKTTLVRALTGVDTIACRRRSAVVSPSI